MILSTFDQHVLSALQPFPIIQPAATVARRLYPCSMAHRYFGTIGRALHRMAGRGLVKARRQGWYLADRHGVRS